MKTQPSKTLTRCITEAQTTVNESSLLPRILDRNSPRALSWMKKHSQLLGGEEKGGGLVPCSYRGKFQDSKN